jgi:ankyrin repeat protein
MQAVIASDVEAAQTAIAQGADPNRRNADGIFPLWKAVDRGDSRMVQALLAKGANPNLKGENGRTPLHHALVSEHVDIAKILLESKADPNAISLLGELPLMFSAVARDAEAVTLLLEHGAAVNLSQTNTDTALIAAADAGSIDCMRILLTWGADVEKKGAEGRTALMAACMSGHLEACKMLLRAGARLEPTNSSGFDALTGSLITRQFDTSRWLIHAGAPCNLASANSLELRFCVALYEKLLADELTAGGKLSEAGATYTNARTALSSLRDEFHAEAKRANSKAASKEFWDNAAAALAQGLAEGLVTVGNAYQAQYSYRSQAQLFALRNASSPEQYSANYHLMMSRYDPVIEERKAKAIRESAGQQPQIQVAAPVDDAGALRAKAAFLESNAKICERFIAEIANTKAPR